MIMLLIHGDLGPDSEKHQGILLTSSSEIISHRWCWLLGAVTAAIVCAIALLGGEKRSGQVGWVVRSSHHLHVGNLNMEMIYTNQINKSISSQHLHVGNPNMEMTYSSDRIT